MSLGPSEIRAVLPSESTRRSTTKAIAIFVPAFSLYLASLTAVPFLFNTYAKLFLSLVNAVLIAILFVIGHDACHGSFTSHKWLNHLLGRLAFLPSLHPFTSWELGHNRLHHCWTNLKGRDYVWTPLSLNEYHALSWFLRLRERLYRSPLGVGAYYFIEIWWKHMVFPQPTDVAKMQLTPCVLDRALVCAYLMIQVTLVALLTNHYKTNFVSSFLTIVILPQLVWNWLMGFVVFQHHTHPRVTWYDNPQEWSFFAGQIQGTVHVIFPWPIGFILHNIMEHTAHHIDPKIPLYNLPVSQRAICDAFSADVIQTRFTPGHLLEIMSRCQLYDYRNRRWLDFSGKPT